MPRPEAASIEWYVLYMRLHNDGLVPTVSPPEMLPSRHDVLRVWGTKTNKGVWFDSHGSNEYQRYVRRLYKRVLQLEWPDTDVIPLHFARGLLAEAIGEDVNWAEFAFKMTHHHLMRNAIPRVLPEYMDIKSPLKPFPKVLPVSAFEVLVPGLCYCHPAMATLSSPNFIKFYV